MLVCLFTSQRRIILAAQSSLDQDDLSETEPEIIAWNRGAAELVKNQVGVSVATASIGKGLDCVLGSGSIISSLLSPSRYTIIVQVELPGTPSPFNTTGVISAPPLLAVGLEQPDMVNIAARLMKTRKESATLKGFSIFNFLYLIKEWQCRLFICYHKSIAPLFHCGNWTYNLEFRIMILYACKIKNGSNYKETT